MNNRNLLRRLYYDIEKSPVAFAGARNLFREAQKQSPTLTFVDVVRFLEREKTYVLHRRVKRHYVRDSVRAWVPFESCMIDLMDYQLNPVRRMRYVFVLTDCFSRYTFCEPLKHKNSSDTTAAFCKIQKRIRQLGYVICSLSSDSGKEFMGEFGAYVRKHAISHFMQGTGEFHCPMVERMIRTLKERIEKYKTYSNSDDWLTPLQPIVNALNKQPRAPLLNRSPEDVVEHRIGWEKISALAKEKSENKRRNNPQRFKINQLVRVSKEQGGALRQKGYISKWSNTVYKVAKVLQGRDRICYLLEDAKTGEDITSIFYNEDLIPFFPNDDDE